MVGPTGIDTQGDVIVGYLYDLNNGKIVSE